MPRHLQSDLAVCCFHTSSGCLGIGDCAKCSQLSSEGKETIALLFRVSQNSAECPNVCSTNLTEQMLHIETLNVDV